jgi:hypothetical protein
MSRALGTHLGLNATAKAKSHAQAFSLNVAESEKALEESW